MLAESGATAFPERIPDTLQALIAARIDRLPPAEKALLHRAAVIGRIFWHGAIAHVAPDLDVDALCSTTCSCETSCSPSRGRRSSASARTASSTCSSARSPTAV